MAQADEIRRQQILQHRFEAMGLEVGVLAGGRALLVTLSVGPEPFETPGGPRVLRAVRFYTVGHDRIKCVAPRALFFVPLVRIADCESARELEARIRAAWAERMRGLARTRGWLDGLGIVPASPAGAPAWSFPLGLEDARARGVAVEPGRVVLPSRGPLSGVVLGEAGERLYQPEVACASAVDLELAVTGRLEQLARRSRRPAPRPRASELPTPRVARRVPVLVVGPHLAGDRPLQDALRRRGFAVEGARALGDALDAFRTRTFEAVLAEARLDRADGLELIHDLRALPGILELPVALVDDRPRDGRRDEARAAGATAYWTAPLAPERAADAVAQLACGDRRRFTRYPRALSVSWTGCHEPGVTGAIGRRGMFLRTTAAPPPQQRYALHLPEAGATLEVDAESVYRLPEAGVGPEGVGLRFCGFDAGVERTWIEFLAGMASQAGASVASG